jgi:hypothetical protein
MLPWLLTGLGVVAVIAFLILRDATLDDRRRKAGKRGAR